MKDLIKIIRVFYYVCIAIAFAVLYAIITRGVEWAPFFLIALVMVFCLREEIKDMEKDIRTSLDVAVKEVWDYCKGLESGEYSIEYLHNGNRYYITFNYDISCIECRGAEFMGEYEIVADNVTEEIEVIDFECRNDYTDEIIDCGFSKDELQERL